jgi:hypothetical protein
MFRGVRYDFGQTPTPEPVTLILAGEALAGPALPHQNAADEELPSPCFVNTR